MTRLVRETLVRAPPETVWAALVEPNARQAWLASMAETPADAPLSVGTVVRGRRKAPGSRSSYESVVRVLDAPRRLEMDVRRNGAPAGRGGYELAADADGTRVRAFAEYELTGLQRMMGPVVAAGLQGELDADLAGLKRHVEKA